MPTTMSLEEHGEGIGGAWTVLRDNAARAGLGAAVPTCPGWTVRDLVAHQGMVHRWAAQVVRGGRDDDACEGVEQEGLAAPDLLAWLDEGAKDLLAALAFAPNDLDVWFFLPDAPCPRTAWARRQSHETTIHAVDAMAASLGRVPRASETWIHARHATDGVDELLLGFVPRRSIRPHRLEPRTVVVRTSDTGAAWTLHLDGQQRVRARPGESEAHTPAVEVGGTATQVYLGLWNRGDELTCTDPGFLESWRREVQVLW